MKWYQRIDWNFFALTIGILAFPWALYHLPAVDPNLVGWTLAALAAGMLLFRLIGWYEATPTGMRMLAVILIGTLILGAIGQRQLVDNPTALNPVVTYFIISQRLACIGAAIYWTRWTDTKASPFVRSTA